MITGILAPKQPNSFRVIFEHSTDLQAISNQIVNVYPPENTFGNLNLAEFGINSPSEPGNLYFEYEDDILSEAAKAVNELGVNRSEFNMVVEILDGNEKVIEQMMFKECKVMSHTHVNNLDYAASSSPREMQVKFNPKALVGNLVEEIPGADKLIGLLEKFFNEMTVSINSGQRAVNGIVHRGVNVEFKHRKDVYPKW